MSLPPIKGKYTISTSSWKVPIPRRVFGDAKFKVTGEHAFQIEEVAFQIFYPCDSESKKTRFGEYWLERPLAQWTDGYAKFLGASRWFLFPLVSLLGTILKIPSYVGAPLKAAPEAGKWPLVFFSHGLAGTKRTYSQICGKLAAEGYIVIAMEHRDGTAPASTYPINGKVESRYYVKVEELDWDKKPSTPLPLRTQQLEIRYVEVLETFKAFKALINGDESHMGSREEYTNWDSWRDQVNTDSITFTGHSFGGCTALYILTHPVPSEYETLPISKAILHDPWMEPFSDDFEDKVIKDNAAFSIPVITINSEEFTVWRQHFARQEKLLGPWVKQAGRDSAFLTLAKSRHMAFSDFPVFSPFKKVPMAMHEDMHRMSVSFIKGDLREFLKSIEKRTTKDLIVDNPEDNKKKHIRAETGTVIIHKSSDTPTHPPSSNL